MDKNKESKKKNDTVIDLTRSSIHNENYKPPKKIHKGKKVNQIESPKRRKITASSALKTIDPNINKTKSSKSEKSVDPKVKYSVMDFKVKNRNNGLIVYKNNITKKLLKQTLIILKNQCAYKD